MTMNVVNLTENAKFYFIITNIFEGSVKVGDTILSNILYISIETQKSLMEFNTTANNLCET